MTNFGALEACKSSSLRSIFRTPRSHGRSVAAGDVKPFFGGTLMPAPYEEYESKAKKLPETMFIRRHYLENLLRRLLLSPSKTRSNVHTITGSVRTLDIGNSPTGPRVSAIVIRQTNGSEITINDPTLVAGIANIRLII